MTQFQKTIKETAKLTGTGLHTGVQVNLNITPAPVNHGYKFKRIDLENSPVISATADNVVDTSRGTTIEENGAKVNTIEHILAALAGSFGKSSR